MPNGGKKGRELPTCDDMENEFLEFYDPFLCMNVPWSEYCPPEGAVCLGGDHLQRKCILESPLAYNVSISVDVEKVGFVQKSRDLGTDKQLLEEYIDSYAVGKQMYCQVYTTPDSSKDVKWIDERVSHVAFQWWKWSMFTGSFLVAMVTTIMAIYRYINRDGGNGYHLISRHRDDDHDGGNAITGNIVRPSAPLRINPLERSVGTSSLTVGSSSV